MAIEGARFLLSSVPMIEVEPSNHEGAITTLADHGAVSFDHLYDPTYIARVAGAFDHYFDRELLDRGGCYNDVGDRRYMIPLPLRAPFTDDALCDPPALRALFTAALGEDYVIQSYGAVLALPGAGPQPFHRDYSLLFDPIVSLPPYALTVVVPLIDMTPELGTTALILGSHTSDARGEHRPYPPRGGCYLWDYRLHHAGLANHAKVRRPILYLVYSRPWFADPENFKKVPPLQPIEGELSPRMVHLFRRARRGARLAWVSE